MTDKLAVIKRRWNNPAVATNDDIAWLITEIDRLREDISTYVIITGEKDLEIETLRIALKEIISKAQSFEHINLHGRTTTAKRAGTLRNCMNIARIALKEIL